MMDMMRSETAERDDMVDEMRAAVENAAEARGVTFASRLNGVKGDDTIALLGRAIWPYSRTVPGMRSKLVEYALEEYPVAVLDTNAKRGVFKLAGHEMLAPNVYFRATCEEGREDPIIVYVVRLVD